MSQDRPRIAIIGAGFSGSLLAAQLMDRCRDGVHVRLYEREGSFARGKAYSTANPSHLLNVPAGRMSAFPDRPNHFVEWLRRLPANFCPSVPKVPTERDFVSRGVYGAYLQHILGQTLWGERGRSRLDLVADEARAVEETAEGLIVTTALGRRAGADIVVMATGNLPAAPPTVEDPWLYGTPLYRNDPWEDGALDGLDPEAPVLLLGTGLTMVDTLLSLADRGHRGPVHALSRRGLLPREHDPEPTTPRPVDAAALPRGVTGMLRFLRAECAAAAAEGQTWRSVLDGVRPHLPSLWQALPEAERRRFLRHLRPWWDVHRHRMAPAVAGRVRTAVAEGRLRLHAGRILRFVPGNLTTLEYRARDGALGRVAAARVINCTGVATGAALAGDPLLDGLLRSGTAVAGELGLGIETTPAGNVVNVQGHALPNLYAVGPLTRERFWESTAVGEIRAQVMALAAQIAEQVEGRDIVARRAPERLAWPPRPPLPPAPPTILRERLDLDLVTGERVGRTVSVRFAARPVVVVRRETPSDRFAPFEEIATAVYGRLLPDASNPEDVLWFAEEAAGSRRISTVRMLADRQARRYLRPRFSAADDVPVELEGWYCESALFR